MSFELYRESYAGAIREFSIGEGTKAVTVGGETCYPFYQFEGNIPHKPKIAMEIWDIVPTDWPEAAIAPFKDVMNDVGAWAKKCVDEFNAEIIVLQLKSIDPNGIDASPEDASKNVKKVLNAIDVPLIIWGIANAEKDEKVFKKIAEDCEGSNLILGPVEDKNHKPIGAAVMGYGHSLISSSPIDVNLAKQVNILLENLGLSMDKVLIDPTTGGLGYGLEYSYSVMERLRMAALAQGDDKLQMPIINNLGNEIWKCKEAKLGIEDMPLLGDPERRGILMEAVGAVSYLMAGSDILIMRHPESIRLVKLFIDLMMNGGDAANISPIEKRLKNVSVDLVALSPTPNLSLNEGKKEKPVAKKDALKVKLKSTEKVDKSKIVSNDIAKKEERLGSKLEVKDDIKSSEKVKTGLKGEDNVRVEKESKNIDTIGLKDEIREGKIKSKTEIKVEVKDGGVKDTEKIEMKKKEQFIREKIAEERARQMEKEEQSIREKRAEERARQIETKLLEKNKCHSNEISKTPSIEQKDTLEKIVDKLKWVHKRVRLYKW